MKRRALLAAAALLVVASSSSAQGQKEISVLGSSPFQPALDILIPKFETKTGYTIKIVYGTGMLSRDQVANGELYDVSIIFAPFPQTLASGQVDIDSGTTLAGIKLAVTVKQGAPKPDISSIEAVKKMLLNAKGIAYVDPTRGSIGQNALSTIRRLGLEEQLRGKTTLGLGGPRAQQLVSSGVAEVNLGPYFNDPIEAGAELVGALPRDVSTPTAVVGFIGIHARDRQAARTFLDYLASPEADATYKEINMEPVP